MFLLKSHVRRYIGNRTRGGEISQEAIIFQMKGDSASSSSIVGMKDRTQI